MSRQSIRARSVVAAAAAILLALVVVGAGVDLFVARDLHRSLDSRLRTRAVEILKARKAGTAPGKK